LGVNIGFTKGKGETHFILIFRLLILNKQFQALLSNLWLDRTASTMALLRVIILVSFILFLRFVGFASHFCLAERPHDRHARFGITDVPDSVREVGIRLTNTT
jgi:hypothetical protein